MATGDYMSDIGAVRNLSAADKIKLKHSDNVDRTTLDMEDFLNLMVVTLQNQTIDNTTDMSQMMNQMVQMSVIQAINDISTLVEDSTSLNYAASLVGKDVTLGKWEGNELKEFEGTVLGTGTLNGRQVIFVDEDADGEPDNTYNLTDIMSIGKMPEKIVDPNAQPEETDKEGEEGEKGEEAAPPAEETPNYFDHE